MITPVPEAHMAIVILTRLNLLALEQIACRDVEPAGTCLHQLIAGNWEAIHVAAADWWVPGMRQRRDSGNKDRNKKQSQWHQRNSLSRIAMPWWRQIHRCLKSVPASFTRPEIPHNTIAHMLDAFWCQKSSAALRTRDCPIKLCLHGAARQFSVQRHCDPPPWVADEWSE